MDWLKKLFAVLFGIGPVLSVAAQVAFPDQAKEIEAGTKVLNAVGNAVQAAEQASPDDGTGAAKKAIALGEVAKVAVQVAADLSTGGQKQTFINKILPIAGQTIDAVVAAANQASAPATQSDPLAGNLQ
jgi:hypothetical protein